MYHESIRRPLDDAAMRKRGGIGSLGIVSDYDIPLFQCADRATQVRTSGRPSLRQIPRTRLARNAMARGDPKLEIEPTETNGFSHLRNLLQELAA